MTYDFNQSPPLITGLVHENPFNPMKDEMEKAAKEFDRPSRVRVKDYCSKTFFLGDPLQVAEYEKVMKFLIEGLTKRTCSISSKDKQYSPELKGWLVNLEWIEFEIQEETVERIGEDNGLSK